jgi:predicted metal-dependent hydrolase
MAEPAPRTIVQGGRAKAYRPIPAADRATAFTAGLDAYDRGDFFLAHELLEPAWMGTGDLPERELYQGLIKLAAAFVHGVRGNPAGIAKNLAGARAHLAEAAAAGHDGGLNLVDLLSEIDRRLAALASGQDGDSIAPPTIWRTHR